MSNNPGADNQISWRVVGADEAERELNLLARAYNQVRESIEGVRESAGQRIDSMMGLGPPQGTGGQGGGVSPEVASEASAATRRLNSDLGETTQRVGGMAARVATLAPIVGEADSAVGELAFRVADLGDFAEVGTQSLSGLASAGPVALAATAAVAAGFIAVRKASAALREEQEKFIDSLERERSEREAIARLIELQTRQELEAERRALLEEINIVADELGRVRARIRQDRQDIADSLAGDIVRPFGETGMDILDVLGLDTDTLDTERDKLKEQLDDLTQQFTATFDIEVQRAVAANEYIDTLEREAEARRETQRLIEQGTTAEVEQRQADLQAQLGSTGQQLDMLRARFAILNPELSEATSGLDNLEFRNFLESQVRMGELDAGAERLADRWLELDDNMAQLNTQLDTTTNRILPTVQARENEVAALEASQAAQERYQQAVSETTTELESTTARIEQLQDSLADEARTRRIERMREAIVASFESRIEEARAAEEQADRLEDMAEVRARTSEQVRSLTVSFQNEQRTRLADHQDSLQALQSDFMESELEAHQDFLKREARLDEDFARNRLRTIEDLNDSLLDAALDNDIKRFIQLQREGEKQLRREAEDFQVADRRRAEDFADERQQARQQFEQRMADLQDQFEAEQEARQENYELRLEELRRQGEEEVQQLREAGRERMRESQRLESELARLREQWRRQDEQRRRQVRLDGMRQELSDMMQHQQNLRNVIRNSYSQLLTELQGAANRFQVPSISSPSSTFSTQTLASQFGAIGATGGTNTSINVSSLNVGSVTTQEDLDRAFSGLAAAVGGSFG